MGIFSKMLMKKYLLTKSLKSLLLCSFVLLPLIGCGPSRPETAQVSGKITFNGQPVPAGRIAFWPPKGRPAIAEIRPDGSYELTSFSDGDGAILGQHRVTIKATRVHFPGGDRTKGVVEWLVPQSYENAKTSPLKAEVSAGKNTINFDIPK